MSAEDAFLIGLCVGTVLQTGFILFGAWIKRRG